MGIVAYFNKGQSLIVGTTPDLYHLISWIDCPIISYYQSPPPLLLDLGMLALQGPIYESIRSVSKGKKKLVDIIVIVCATNQIITSPKDIHNRLESNKPKEFVKSG
jgi:hypothetical protein